MRLVLVALVAFAVPARAEPVAVVEEAAQVGEPKRLDLLSPGHIIELGRDGRIVLGYLKSCWQERIVGGRVVVEELRSRAEGAVTRRLVDCDKTGQGTRGLVAEPATAHLPKPDLIVFGLSPVVLLAPGAVLAVERLDRPAKVAVPSAERVDFAALGIALAADGLYRFRAGEVSRVVRVDGFAEAGAAPLVGRLVILR
jgi:hypothetical protein